MPVELTIGELSARSGVAASALRFYEERGLIASERAGSGHRRFPRAVLRRIAFIVFAQRVGLTLGQIAGVLEGVEAIGLWFERRWAEYLTVVATASLLPIEVLELTRHATPLKAAGFVVNVAVVVYLVVAKRLFGVRGGRARYERELQGQSLLEVEAAGARPGYGHEAPGKSGRDEGMSDVSADRAEHATR